MAKAAQSYEVALFGEFFAKDLSGAPLSLLPSTSTSGSPPAAILNRITLHSESAHQMHAREIVFEPFDAQHQRDTGNEPVLLRARREMLEENPKWCVHTSALLLRILLYRMFL